MHLMHSNFMPVNFKSTENMAEIICISCLSNAACVWSVCGFCFFCLCYMHGLNPLLMMDTTDYRPSFHTSQVTLLPLSPAPPISSLPVASLSHLLPIFLFFFPPSLLCLLWLLSSLVLFLLIQPLMTCLKPTVGNTVRQGTEALPSHRPSQRAAAQGKVHTQTTRAHTIPTHT